MYLAFMKEMGNRPRGVMGMRVWVLSAVVSLFFVAGIVLDAGPARAAFVVSINDLAGDLFIVQGNPPQSWRSAADILSGGSTLNGATGIVLRATFAGSLSSAGAGGADGEGGRSGREPSDLDRHGE